MRIDKAVSPPGFIKSAECFSLFAGQRGLYLIKTGRGWRINFRATGLVGIPAQMAADKVVQVIQDKASAEERAIAVDNLDAEVARRKGSVLIPWEQLAELELKSRYDGVPDLRFKGGSTKYRVQFDQGRDAEVEAFVNSFRR